MTDNTDIGIGSINPIRYRGYYFDSETGLYYLQSRYYDAQVGRFINADEYVSTGQGLSGNNMFIYCLNNPVNMSDGSGHWPQWFKDAVNSVIASIVNKINQAVQIVNDIAMDCKNYDKYNTSEEKVIESNYFSSYKGVPVFRTNLERSGSFGAIFLSRYKENDRDPVDTVRHEYGHIKQLEVLGPAKFALCIGLPSIGEWGPKKYYNKPWEITADMAGGVNKSYKEADIYDGFIYMEISRKAGPLAWLYIE